MANYSSAAYTYDGNGLRVKKVSGSTTTVYIFSGSKVIAEYDNGAAPGSPSREYLYSGGALLAKVEGGATSYYHPDHLSTRVMTDTSGTSIGSRAHYPYGETWYESGTTTKLKFTSYERDAESSNDYAMARFHVNRFGRFSSLDPLAGNSLNPQSLNRYRYTLGDPVNLVDPLGLFNLPVLYCYGVEDGIRCSLAGFLFLPDPWQKDPHGGGGGRGPRGGPMDVSELRGNALVALLNPDCANLFGGFANAVTSLFNSSYNRYIPGQENPFPGQIGTKGWNNMVQAFSGDHPHLGANFSYSSRPGGIIFFPGQFNVLDPGFATSPDQVTQMTLFFHEQEHAANHDPLLNRTIDASPASYAANAQKINKRCKPPQVEQESFTITGGLTLP